MNQDYDYIIIGAGSSGCVVANRLSADPKVRVLLVESGPDDTSPFIRMPRGIGVLLKPGSRHVFEYQASPGGNAPPETWMKGRAIGGSSAVNGMIYMRGAPFDYDGWAALGCTGWGWDEIGPRFAELEDHQLGAKQWRGAGGPVRITLHPPGNPLCEAVLDAAIEAGTPRVEDVNDMPAVLGGGMGYQPTNIWHGTRYSSARAFLTPVRGRRNLDVLPLTDVLRISLDGRRATGIMIRNKQGERSIAARREVILSAGAIHSPKLLQLSGIGPAALLQAYGIPVAVDAPGVGRNLREHRYLSMQYRVTGGSHNRDFGGVRLLRALLNYILFSRGPMTHSAHEVGGFVKTRPGLEHPDAQIGLGLFSIDAAKGIAVDPFPGMTFIGNSARPESQGELRIQSPDPMAPPFIDANHLSAEIDRVNAVSLFHWMRALGKQPALAKWIVEETGPTRDVETDDQILQNFLSMGRANHHICGTARMGSDEGAVLDPQLRVRGVDGLRVVDTSIMPTIVGGNTNGPAMAIGLRAADIILAGSS